MDKSKKKFKVSPFRLNRFYQWAVVVECIRSIVSDDLLRLLDPFELHEGLLRLHEKAGFLHDAWSHYNVLWYFNDGFLAVFLHFVNDRSTFHQLGETCLHKEKEVDDNYLPFSVQMDWRDPLAILFDWFLLISLCAVTNDFLTEREQIPLSQLYDDHSICDANINDAE